VHWIVGGKRKGDDLDACAQHLDHVVAAYTIGEAAPLFFDLLKDKVPLVEQSGTLEAAVAHAAAAARAVTSVLLSPACASFDQFRDYEARATPSARRWRLWRDRPRSKPGPRPGLIGSMKGRGGRGDRSPLGTWFWDIDRVLLLLTLFLIAIGLVAVAAASPATAMRYSGEHRKFARSIISGDR
jgi:hypothetical protein